MNYNECVDNRKSGFLPNMWEERDTTAWLGLTRGQSYRVWHEFGAEMIFLRWETLGWSDC